MKDESFYTERRVVFEKLLENVNGKKVTADTYCQKYLGHLLDHKKYYLAIYADVLEKLCLHSEKKREQLSLIDLGAGNGLLGIFAKFCGFDKVYINDIDEKFVEAAKALASILNIGIDGFITGDIKNIQSFFSTQSPDAIIGTDVIEHIYNLDDFFDSIRQLNSSMVTIFTTASNPKNYFKIKRIKKLQLKDEYEGGAPADFALFGDRPLEAFYKIRKEIICTELKTADEATINQLAKATRGMNKADIITAAQVFKVIGKIPKPLSHPTNTCNPLSSSWTERILPVSEYRSLYESHGMHLKIYNGFYNEYRSGIKKILNKLLNISTNIAGIYFAPYIILTGTKK